MTPHSCLTFTALRQMDISANETLSTLEDCEIVEPAPTASLSTATITLDSDDDDDDNNNDDDVQELFSHHFISDQEPAPSSDWDTVLSEPMTEPESEPVDNESVDRIFQRLIKDTAVSRIPVWRKGRK